MRDIVKGICGIAKLIPLDGQNGRSLRRDSRFGSSADPVAMPATLRKSRRERYCEYGVISEGLIGTDLYWLFILTFYSLSK